VNVGGWVGTQQVLNGRYCTNGVSNPRINGVGGGGGFETSGFSTIQKGNGGYTIYIQYMLIAYPLATVAFWVRFHTSPLKILSAFVAEAKEWRTLLSPLKVRN
jgi:hypothetical protein